MTTKAERRVGSMRPVVLRGEKVSLGVLLKEDMEKIWMWNNDREVVRTLADPSDVSTLEEWHRWYENLSLKKSSKRAFAILNEGNNLVGTVIVSRIDLRNGTAEIGYFLGGREHWGKGYGTETVRLLCEYAFAHLNLHKVWAKVHADNKASIRVLEKNGFTLAGRLGSTSGAMGNTSTS